MYTKMIREANDRDKITVLKFCKDTFSWGDYIEHVWDFWLSEEHLLLFEKQSPIGICMHFFLLINFGLKESELILFFVDKKLHPN